MERLTATVVLVLGTLVLAATLVSVATDSWEPTGRPVASRGAGS